jgi:hypothetical protein
MIQILTLLIVTASCALSTTFREHTIATDLKGGYQVIAVDMNRDGKLDLVAVASGMSELVWFENPGWERHVIVRNMHGMINVAAWDTDGDGIPELVLASEFSNEAKKSIGLLTLLKHDGDPRQEWTATEIDRLTTSHRLRWADIDGKGRKVLVNAPLTGAKAEPPDYRDSTPLVFYRPGEWKRQVIGNENQGVVHGIYITDWDGDGRDDILTASFSGIHLYRYGRDHRWARTEIAKGDPAAWPKGGSSDVAVGMLGKKRFVAAIEPWHGEQVVVYADDRNVIDTTLVNGHTIVTADLHGKGRDAIIAGCRGGSHSVYIYKADDSTAKHWTRRTLDNGGMAAAGCVAADLNGDGRIDIACIGTATANLKWYENIGGRPSR